MSSNAGIGVPGHSWTLRENTNFAEFLRSTDGLREATVIIDSTVRDTGNSPSTSVIRAGNLVTVSAADNRAYIWGTDFTQVTAEALDGQEDDFAQPFVVPYSETIYDAR